MTGGNSSQVAPAKVETLISKSEISLDNPHSELGGRKEISHTTLFQLSGHFVPPATLMTAGDPLPKLLLLSLLSAYANYVCQALVILAESGSRLTLWTRPQLRTA